MQRWRRATALAGMVGLALAGVLAGPSARAQDTDLGPLPKPVTIYLLDRAAVTVTFDGDYGPVRVTGVLQDAPKDALHLTGAPGKTRDAAWSEIRSLTVATVPTVDTPAGTRQVSLLSDPTPASQTQPGSYAARVLNGGETGWRLAKLPEGSLTLRGEPYGTLAVPTARITSFQMEAIRGNITDVPAGTVRLEVMNGTSVSIPLESVQWLQRDVPNGTATVTLLDDQSFTGKLVEVPKVTLAVDTDKGKQNVAFDQVAQFERVPPGGRKL
jgi:hypothetical protein